MSKTANTQNNLASWLTLPRQKGVQDILSNRSTFRRDNQVHTTEEIQVCVESGFPICLSEGLLRIFGSEGKKILDTIVMNRTSGPDRVASGKAICDLYAEYLGHLTSIFGESTMKVIEIESFKSMRHMSCTKCSMCELEHNRKEKNYDPWSCHSWSSLSWRGCLTS